jgi:hypothetical protein
VEDKEVIAPPIVMEDSPTLSSGMIPLLKLLSGIAASLTAVDGSRKTS